MESYSGVILIVDDKPENILPLQKILSLNHFLTETASSGEQALRKVLKQNYSLIILDVQMPGMDGFEVAEAITGYSKIRDIPILFLSAVNREKEFIKRGYQSGGMDYLTKPVDPEILILKVKTFYKIYEQKQKLIQAQVVLTREVDERKKAQESLARMNETLEEKVKMRTRELQEKNRQLETANKEMESFTWVVSHDLREPLRKIETFSGMICERLTTENEHIKSLLERTMRSSRRLSALIEDLLSYTQLYGEHSYELTDMNELVRRVLNDMAMKIDEKHANVRLNPLPRLEVVPEQMQQVFHQLIANSLKFCGDGKQPEIVIEGSVHDNGHDGTAPTCELVVKDNGMGFNPKYRDRIFIIFQRLHEGGAFEGTGVGLALVKKVMDNHHGSVTAESDEGRGATFRLTLPVQQKKQQQIT